MLALTPDERRVILFFLAANAAGLGLLAFKRSHPTALPGLRPEAAGLPAAADTAAAPAPAAAGQIRPGKELLTGTVDINAADEQTLQRLPGIGPAMARRIAEHRRTVGRFRSPRELGRVKGIGPKKLKLLLEHVTVGP
ncbi:MAG: helix-hairpin-helix domain-containing protein [Candidatus Edwardsbacteria bacterium]|jgi:competence protein ComEA|nr:helix-hairpin-helix domain-containing protein [Candidatus Edwardsbacteria bacterium]